MFLLKLVSEVIKIADLRRWFGRKHQRITFRIRDQYNYRLSCKFIRQTGCFRIDSETFYLAKYQSKRNKNAFLRVFEKFHSITFLLQEPECGELFDVAEEVDNLFAQTTRSTFLADRIGAIKLSCMMTSSQRGLVWLVLDLLSLSLTWVSVPLYPFTWVLLKVRNWEPTLVVLYVKGPPRHIQNASLLLRCYRQILPFQSHFVGDIYSHQENEFSWLGNFAKHFWILNADHNGLVIGNNCWRWRTI